jgi:hypothetical protein
VEKHKERRDMCLRRANAIAGFFLAALLSAPVWAADTNARAAVPGTVNYVEGQASIADQTVDAKSIGTVELQAGQSLTTNDGKVEILLTPGVFLRVGANSSVKMMSSSITNTEVGIDKGHAMIEVAEIHPQNDIRISAGGSTAQLLKTGLYDFNLDQGAFRVFDGEAKFEGNSGQVTVKSGRQVSLNSNGPLKTEKFNKKTYQEDDLYRWSSLRSAYLAEANVNASTLYVNNGWGPWGPGWWGAGWYWNPWYSAYTFIPGDGIFYSPFGWGFYSPWWVSRAPFYGYGPAPYYRHFSTNINNWGPGNHYVGARNYANGIYRGPGSTGGGFQSGPRTPNGTRGFGASPGFHDGGFHGGVGFHGGGGFHGR